MAAEPNLLNTIHVASPCSAAWDRMEGDDRARYCGECRKHVYNLSDMSTAEAEALVREKEGNLCGRFYRRRDGTVMTDNCPVGLRRLRRALIFQGGALMTAFAGVPVFGMAVRGYREWGIWQHEPYHSFAVRHGIIEAPAPIPGGMGFVAGAPSPSPAPPGP